MPGYNGLNGTIMLNTGREGLTVGHVPGDGYGYARRLKVTLDLRIERLERRETYETTTHEHVARPLAMSVTTSVWRPHGKDIVAGGATREPLREVAAHGEPARFWDVDHQLARMASMGDRWHLNDMQPGCLHQEVVYEDSDYGTRPSLTETLPCPITGYRYGSSWLIDPVPRVLLNNLLDDLIAGPIANRNIYVHPDLDLYRR